MAADIIARLESAEEWRPVPGSPHEVSIRGDVRRLDGKPIKTEMLQKGYLRVSLQHNGKNVRWPIHRLIYTVFVGPIPDGLFINHKDGIKTNNSPDNLELVTTAENARHASRMGLLACGVRNGASKLNPESVRKIRRMRDRGATYKTIAEKFGVHQSVIGHVVRRILWRHVD